MPEPNLYSLSASHFNYKNIFSVFFFKTTTNDCFSYGCTYLRICLPTIYKIVHAIGKCKVTGLSTREQIAWEGRWKRFC